jgi:Tat protein secretion system quality control protein TatD with DNase activity
VHTFGKVAELRNEAPDSLAEQLWKNANRAMGIET